MLFLVCGDALAPTRRVALRHAAGAAALSLTTERAAAATNAEAEKVRVASRELNELLKNEDALRFKVLGGPASCRRCQFYNLPEARERLRRRFYGRGDRVCRNVQRREGSVKLAVLSKSDGAFRMSHAVLRARAPEPGGGVREARRRRQAAAEVGPVWMLNCSSPLALSG